MTIRQLYIFLILLLTTALSGKALDPEYYAPASVLSQGKWAKVAVKETGMQFVSNATLRALGFSNPDKVNVYGYGGRMLPERLDTETPDDLPKIVSLRTGGGIVFFGHSSVTWEEAEKKSLKYTHTTNPYSDNSYYFLSDSDAERPTAAQREDLSAAAGTELTVFTERLLHEQDLLAPSTSGRVILGEDFRTQTSRTFTFNLPDNTGDANIKITFGAKVTNGSSTLSLSTTTGELTVNSHNIPGVSDAGVFLNLSSMTTTVKEPGDRLVVGLNYNHSGALFTAALDHIEVEYPRELRLRNDELYFYLSPSEASEVKLSGVGESTVLWDVTDPVRPLAVNLRTEGSEAFFITPSGYREYVAFNPLKVSRAATGAGSVRNQNLHGMAAPGMLVVSPEQYRTHAQKLADLHAKTDGLSVAVVSPEEVYNEFSCGNPDVTAFRRLLKMWYDRRGDSPEGYTRFCLLFSRPTYDNKMATPTVKRAGYPRIPIWQEPKTFTETGSFSTDDYIGMLDDQYGTLNMGNARIHTAVGRMPVKNATEAANAIAKLEKYLLSPQYGPWRNNVMVIADDQDNGEHLRQAEDVIEKMRSEDMGQRMVYEKLYLDAYPLGHSGQGAVYPEAKQRMMGKISEGVALIDYIGHANTRSWGHENLLTWTDITSMSNTKLPFLYAATCSFLYWDADEVSGGEEMWLHPDAGVIGMICPNRKVFISANGQLNSKTASWFFRADETGQSLPLGEIMINGKNDSKGDTNKLRYAFLGDPSMRLPSPAFTAEVETINGAEANASELPELKARSKVTLSGKIRNTAGEVAENFNGTVDLQLFDAEKVVDTYGNGAEGAVMTFNDRKTRLYIGKTTVRSGQWSTEFMMPSEIENNYSPVLFSLYALNESGEEASGAFEGFYVYGFESGAEEDNEGPLITDYYINSPGFSDKDAIGPNLTVFATLADTSGINLSEAGIGHKMTLTLDGKEWHDDLNLYFTPDVETSGKGTLMYPLNGVGTGEHTLTLTVWDTAGNSSSSSLDFSVRADWQPTISTLGTDVNPASTAVVFTVEVDGATGTMPCKIEVFDLGGKMVWSTDNNGFTERVNSLSRRWDLKDDNGRRVGRGIYLYRATVRTPEGHVITKTRKLAVTGE